MSTPFCDAARRSCEVCFAVPSSDIFVRKAVTSGDFRDYDRVQTFSDRLMQRETSRESVTLIVKSQIASLGGSLSLFS